jgi:hypothetical protein
MARRPRRSGWKHSSVLTIICAAILISLARAQSPTPERISLAEAIRRAQASEPTFAASIAAQKSAAINGYLAKAALLPSAIYNNQMLFTQSNGKLLPGTRESAPIFIANNGVQSGFHQ